MLAIITVIYKNYTILPDFFASLRLQYDQDFRVWIIDLTPPEAREIITFPDERYTLLQGENKGYAHGANLGVAAAIAHGAIHFAIVNPDIVFDTYFTKMATHSLRQHPATLIGGLIYYAPGYEYHKEKISNFQFPISNKISNVKKLSTFNFQLSTTVPFTIWYAGGHIDWAHATSKHVGVDDLDHPMYHEPGQTDFITGCCMIYDLAVVKKVGQWDESYFMYYEDTDYCMRARKKNIESYYDPTIVLWHKNAQSTGGSGSDLHIRTMERSRLRFGLKYAPLRTKLHLMKNHIFFNKSSRSFRT